MSPEAMLLEPNAHAAKGVVLRAAPAARAFYVGNGEWAVYPDPMLAHTGDVEDDAIGHGFSLALAWQDACGRVEDLGMAA